MALIAGAATTGPAWASWANPLAAGSSGEAHAAGLPSAPTDAAAACVSALSNTIRVTWSAVAQATTYSVYQATLLTGPYTVTASGITTTSWTSGSLSSGSYWYEVSAYEGANWQSPTSTPTGSSTVVKAGNTKTCTQP